MTEKDLRTLYQRETGEYAPEPYQQDEYDKDYIRWLEEQVLKLKNKEEAHSKKVFITNT